MSVINDMGREASASSRPSRSFVFTWPAKSHALQAPPTCAPRAAGTITETRPKFGCPEPLSENATTEQPDTRSKYQRYYQRHREKLLAKKKATYQQNVEKFLAENRVYRERNPDYAEKWRAKNKHRHSGYVKAYNARHPERVKARDALRRVLKLVSRPPSERTAIDALYEAAQSLGLTVDHIIPLKHPDICGLHRMSNLQLLTHAENSAKGNKFTPYSSTP